MGTLRLRLVIVLSTNPQFEESRFVVRSTKHAPSGAVQFKVTDAAPVVRLVMRIAALPGGRPSGVGSPSAAIAAGAIQPFTN